jgi:hypothetical protein
MPVSPDPAGPWYRWRRPRPQRRRHRHPGFVLSATLAVGLTAVGLACPIKASAAPAAGQAATVAAGLAGIIPTGTYQPLYDISIGQCLGILNGSTSQGAQAIQWPCNGHPDQQWLAEPVSGSEYELINSNDGMCLGILNGSTSQGAQAIQWPCNGHADQMWSVSSVNGDGNAPVNLVNVKSSMCLGIQGGGDLAGTQAIQWPCNGHPDQQWTWAWNEESARMNLLARIADSTPNMHLFGLQDSNGNSMDTLKVIPYNGSYIGVYHTKVNGSFVVKLATSTDLMYWAYQTDLDQNASQPYLAAAANRSFVLADEANDAIGSHLRFLHYPDLSSLYQGSSDTGSDIGRSLSGCNEGTPDIHWMNSSGTSIDFGFHYNSNCSGLDREAFGTLTDLGPTPSVTKTEDTVRDVAVSAIGYPGKHGGREDIVWRGYRFSLQEAQDSTNITDNSTWRFVLYDYSNDTAYPAPITNSVSSACHGNPGIIQLNDPDGQSVLVITAWIFPGSPPQGCAINGEDGELLYTVPAD